jgi:hypothetical protein
LAIRRPPAPASITTRCSPTTTREALPQFPASYVGKYFYADLGGGWIRVFDPANPGSVTNPDTSSPFASGISGNLIDLKVDHAGNLYYLTGSGAVEKVAFQSPGIATQPVGRTVDEGQSATFTVAASGPSLAYQWQHLVGTAWVNVGTNSPAYTIAAATTADAGVYRVIVANPAGSVVSDTVVLTVNPAPAVILVPGLKAEFFDFTTRLNTMPSLAGRVADVTRTDAVINYPPTRRSWAGLDTRFADTFAVRETGFLVVSNPGRYRLFLRSKDGANLWLDGVLLINNGGIHPLRERTRAVTLTAGLHTLQVESFANTGVAGLTLSWSRPRTAKRVIPADHLVHATVAVRASALRSIRNT